MESRENDRSRVIFGNPQSEAVRRRADRERERCVLHYGDGTATARPLRLTEDGVANFDGAGTEEKTLLIAGFRGDYSRCRVGLAMASCANALGVTPCWLDLDADPDTPAAKIAAAQKNRDALRRKSRLLNLLLWETPEEALGRNAIDQRRTELMAPLFRDVPRDLPVIATHAWAAQAALHAGALHVLNALPGSWPVAAFLAEGSLHTVQTHSAYQSCRVLRGMDGSRVLNPMPSDSLACVGHYVDDGVAANLATDCAARTSRKINGAPLRFLLSMDGDAQQKEIFAALLKHLRPAIMRGAAAVYVNLGDRAKLWDYLCEEVPGLKGAAVTHFNEWAGVKAFTAAAASPEGSVEGVHVFCHDALFPAVYTTNLLLRSADVLVTKPGELAYYPVPKLFLPRTCDAERWGALHSAALGDGTMECADIPHVLQMADLFLNEDTILMDMLENIVKNQVTDIYEGGYWAVRLAMGMKQ